MRWNGCALEERRPSWLFRNLCSWVAIFNVSRGGTDCVPKEWIDLAPQQWPCISLLDGGTLKLKVSFTPEQMEIANTAERELCLLCIFLHVGNWTIVITSGIAEYAYKPNNAEFSTFYFYFSRKINCKEIPWRPICWMTRRKLRVLPRWRISYRFLYHRKIHTIYVKLPNYCITSLYPKTLFWHDRLWEGHPRGGLSPFNSLGRDRKWGCWRDRNAAKGWLGTRPHSFPVTIRKIK